MTCRVSHDFTHCRIWIKIPNLRFHKNYGKIKVCVCVKLDNKALIFLAKRVICFLACAFMGTRSLFWKTFLRKTFLQKHVSSNYRPKQVNEWIGDPRVSIFSLFIAILTWPNLTGSCKSGAPYLLVSASRFTSIASPPPGPRHPPKISLVWDLSRPSEREPLI